MANLVLLKNRTMKIVFIVTFTFMLSTAYSQYDKFVDCGFEVTHVSEKISETQSNVSIRVTNISNITKYISILEYTPFNIISDTTAIYDQSYGVNDPPSDWIYKFVQLKKGEIHFYEKIISTENISILKVIFDYIDESKLVNRKLKIIPTTTKTFGIKHKVYNRWVYKKKLIKYVMEISPL
jgi:hypothetical protein